MNVEIGKQSIIILFWTRSPAVSFLGIHKSEPDIYIGFSPALHLQCNAAIVPRTFEVLPYLAAAPTPPMLNLLSDGYKVSFT
jgi:hypothetical protein